MRISFLILLVNALLFTQIASAAKEDVKLKSALLKAMKTHDTKMVKAIADGGYKSIDRDDVLQEKIFEYLDAEREREIQAKEKAKANAIAKEKAKADAITAKKRAKEKAKTDAIAKKNAEKKAAAAAVAAKKSAEEKKKKDALAAKNKAKADKARKAKAAAAAVATKKAADKKKKKDALAAKKAKEAKASEKKRKDAAAAKKKAAAEKQAKAKKAAPKKQSATKKAAPKVKAVPKAVIAAPVVAAPVAAAVTEPLTVSNKRLLGTWKQISSEKVITLVVEEDTSFVLEQIEDDGTLVISGTWKSEENIFMMTIKRVQRNVHSRETNIHRIYKVDRLSKHRLVLRDKRNRIAYDLKR